MSPLCQETLHHTVAVDAADRVDLGARDRLLVGDDRQRFERGAAQVSCRLQAQEALDQFGKLWGGRQLETTGVPLEAQAAGREGGIQLVQPALDHRGSSRPAWWPAAQWSPARARRTTSLPI